MTPDDILDKALHILERDGWHQGGLAEYDTSNLDLNLDDYDPGEIDDEEEMDYLHWQSMRNAPVCAVGALNRAATGEANGISRLLTFDEAEVLRGVIAQASRRLYEAAGIDSGVSSIPEWNDSKDTTKEDVILAFKRAWHGEGTGA
ncbi:DUF6197 family protein [Streptomyces hydrogenans]|uniref:Uncharacterized protein n=1 Tax=Streptomyces hydrogenans TaxID=1873719 RepID=A0ABQ3PJJ6_9ACTN|nr:hypothetical protein [Streptomyces hydrogenans]GHG10304.1 hypothetical protein GCM10018784_23810 [Streptomyces hydrogenans]GHI25168.1 hypothetical protein Shyd_65390 [Streptomyces hydrogenans]